MGGRASLLTNSNGKEACCTGYNKFINKHKADHLYRETDLHGRSWNPTTLRDLI